MGLRRAEKPPAAIGIICPARLARQQQGSVVWKHRRPDRIARGSGPIEFLGDKDSCIEQEIKSQLRECFRQYPNVRTAYLSRVSHGSSVPESIAVCVRTEVGADQCVLRDARRIMSTIVGVGSFVEVVFIDASQESHLRSRCLPFFGGR